MDSLTVQQTVQTGWGIGSQFIPAAYQSFLPLITFAITSLTGVIIHALKVAQINKAHKAELDALKTVAK